MQKQKKLSCKFFLLTNAPSSLHSWLGLLLIFQLQNAKRKKQQSLTQFKSMQRKQKFQIFQYISMPN
jgi:hypothetical protein